jgi:hypothetical protein
LLLNTDMDSSSSVNNVEQPKKGLGCFSVFGLMLLSVVISVAVTVWVLNFYLFPKRFEPVELSSGEQQVLQQKLDVFESFAATEPDAVIAGPSQDVPTGTLQPLPYTEQGANRTLSLTERELNGILANNTELADKFVVDLSDDLVSARLRIPMDPDFPFFGGKTLKARAGIEIKFEQQRPIVVLKGISVMGVPVPNAWLGGIKNIDLVQQFGQTEGFWKAFSGGVEYVKVVDGTLQISLKE